MATVAQPYGLEPVAMGSSRYNTQGFQKRAIASGYNTNIFYGDVVLQAANGTIERITDGAANIPIGVFLGAEFTGDAALNYRLWDQLWPAGTLGTGVNAPFAHVLDDPNAIFRIQADGAVTQADLGLNAGIVLTAGSTAIKKGRMALDQSTLATTATLPLRVVDFWTGPESTPGDAFTDVIVQFNRHQLRTQAGV